MSSDDLQARLEARLAKLRAPNFDAAIPTTTPGSGSKALERRLSSLDPPSDGNDLDVSVEFKNVDDEVAKYLEQASSSPPSSLPPSYSNRRLNAALESYETLAPAFASPIEVTYLSPSKEKSRTEAEDEALIARLRDELSIENSLKAERGEEQDEWEKRLKGLKAFKTSTGSGSARKAEQESSLGAPPKEVEIGEFKEAARKSEGKASDGDSDDDDSVTSEDTDSQEDSDSDT